MCVGTLRECVLLVGWGALIKYVICECKNTLKVLCVWEGLGNMCLVCRNSYKNVCYVCGNNLTVWVAYMGTLEASKFCVWERF